MNNITVNFSEMRLQHLLIALFSGLLVYFSLLLFYIPQEVQELQQYKTSLEENIEDLFLRGELLESIYYQLKDDPQAIVKEANSIGMVFPGDEVIQSQPRERRVESFSSGERLVLIRPNIQVSTLIRSISLSVSLVLIFVLSAIHYKNERIEIGRTTKKEETGTVNKVGSMGTEFEVN